MNRLAELAVAAQRRIESLYALEAEAPVSGFLMRPAQAARLPGGGSRTLVDCRGEEVSLAVVLSDEVERRLSQDDPRGGLHSGNLPAYCTLIEEVSHYLYLSFCARHARLTTHLELELMGEVDKYLVAADLLSLQNEGALAPGLRTLLFRGYRLTEGLSSEQVERYHTASDLAERYCGWLESAFLRPARPEELCREARRFYRLGQGAKLARIASLQ